LAIALALSGTAAVAQQSDQTSGVQIDAGKVQLAQLSEYGTPIERFWVDRKVSFADLDLATTAGSAELMRRVTEAAKEACAQVHAADPVDLSDMDDTSCVRTATDRALKRVNAVIEQRRNSPLAGRP